MKKLILFLFIAAATTANASDFQVVNKQVGKVQIPFLQSTKDTSGYYSRLPDLAAVEAMAPIDASLLKSLTASDLRNLSLEELSQLYARLGSGPIPQQGNFAGYILKKPPVFDAIKLRLINQVRGVPQALEIAKKVCGREAEDCLIEFLWRGKRFYKKNDMDQIMSKTTFNFVSAALKEAPSFLSDAKDLFNKTAGIIDLASLTAFPANTYCGISQVDTRRESIIIDASYGDDFDNGLILPDYISLRDELVTRKGLNITEEYRMVRPGLYLGRVYTNKLFLMNVAIELAGTPSPETKNECADGSRTR